MVEGSLDYTFDTFAQDAGSRMADAVREGSRHAVCMCIHRSVWEKVGYFPPVPGLWGYEDTAFHLGVLRLSMFRRMPGVTYSFEHNTTDGTADTNGWSRDFDRNKELFERYRASRDHELFQRYSNAESREWLAQELIKINEDPHR